METIVQTYIQTNLCVHVAIVEISIQIDYVATWTKTTQTKDIPPYTPLVVEAIIQNLKTKLGELQQVLQEHQKEVVPWNKYLELLKKFNDLTTTEDETYASLRVEQKKVGEVQE